MVVPAVTETLFCKMICPPYSSPPAGRRERQLHFPEGKPKPRPPRRHGEGHCGAGPRELLAGVRAGAGDARGPPTEVSPTGSQEGARTQAGSCRGLGSNPPSANYLLCDLGSHLG